MTLENGEKIRTVEKIVEKIVERPLRRRLPDTRPSLTHKFNVAGHEGYLTVGLYENGSPGELFITMAKEGSTIGGLMDSLGTAISVALQYGVPLESLVLKFTHQRFEPAGMTHNPDIPFAKSLVDYIFRWMGMEFVPGYRAANAPLRNSAPATDAKAPAPAKAKPERVNQSRPRVAEPDNGNGGNGSNGGDGSDTAKPAEASPIVDASRRRLLADDSAPADRTAGADTTPDAETTSGPGPDGATGAGMHLAAALTKLQADAPACDNCGTITVRNGTCYKCLNCGNSMGCS